MSEDGGAVSDVDLLALRRREWHFLVLGRAAPKGSSRAFPHQTTGRMIFLPMGAGLKAWQRAVAEAASAAGVMRAPKGAPVSLSLNFYRLRPKSHHVAGDRSRPLRPDAPKWPTSVPDLDKLERAVLDGLKRTAYVDDAQVVENLSSKHWADGHLKDTGGVSVTVRWL